MWSVWSLWEKCDMADIEIEYIDVSGLPKDESEKLLKQIYERMIQESKPLDAEFASIMNDNFLDLF